MPDKTAVLINYGCDMMAGLIQKLKLMQLAADLKKAGIEEAFSHILFDNDEFSKTWRKFWRRHKELKRKILIWGEDFILLKPIKLFENGEKPENPLEIAAIIRLIDNVKVSEDELFENRDDLVLAIDDVNTFFAEVIAETIREQLIMDVDCLAVI